MSRRSAAAVLLFGTTLLAQVPTTPPATVDPGFLQPRLQRLGNPATSPEATQRLLDELRPQPAALLAAYPVLLRAQGERLRSFPKAHDRLRKAFLKAVPKAWKANLAGKGSAHLDSLRQQALALSRGKDLTKERIHDEIDPLVDQLQTLALPMEHQVLAAEPGLDPQAVAVRGELEALRAHHDLLVALIHDLDALPGGRAAVDAQPLPASPPAADLVDRDLATACLTGLPLSAADREALDANAALVHDGDVEELRGTLELNRLRIALGLSVLRFDPKLANAARDHSRDMRDHHFFSHESPVEGKRSFGDRASRAGTSASAENIAAGQDSGFGAIRAWWYSPGHHKNMLGNHVRTGLGRCDGLWTQLFGG